MYLNNCGNYKLVSFHPLLLKAIHVIVYFKKFNILKVTVNVVNYQI